MRGLERWIVATLYPSEYHEQCAVFDWARAVEGRYPCLRYLFATLNGVRLPVGLAVKAKRMGNRRGVPDIWLPVPTAGSHGLVLEMKVRGGRLTREQDEWLAYLRGAGYTTGVPYSADEAIQIIERYIGCG